MGRTTYSYKREDILELKKPTPLQRRCIELMNFIDSGMKYAEVPNFCGISQPEHKTEKEKYFHAIMLIHSEYRDAENIEVDEIVENGYHHIYVKRLRGRADV